MMLKMTRRLLRRRAAAFGSALPCVRFTIETLETRTLLAGDGLAASYFNNNSLTGTATLTRVDPTVNFDYGDGSPAAAINSDYFSARWTGQVQATASGATTFSTNSDDGVRLWVNGQQIVNNWSEHAATLNSGTVTLTAGQKYDIKMEYFENAHGAIAQLFWSGPNFSQQIIPQTALYSSSTPDTQAPSTPTGLTATGKSDTSIALAWTASTDNVGVTRYDVYRNNNLVGSSQSTSFTDSGLTALTAYGYSVKAVDAAGNASNGSAAISVTTNASAPPGSGTGLSGTYFDNNDFTNAKLTRVDPTINFDWGSGSPTSTIGVDTFSARWTGQIQAKYSETYTFTLRSDDGSRLFINGQQVVNSWSEHSARDDSGTIALLAGQKYNITVEYFENGFDATMSLSWASASQPKQIVPKEYLYAPNVIADTTPPSAASGLALTGKTSASVSMKWNAATDNVGVASYDIYRGTTKVNSVDGGTLSYTDTSLNASTAYSYTVIARDAAGNSSLASNTLSVTTDAAVSNGSGTGLLAQYFDNADLTNLKVTRTDPTVNFDWGNGSPDASIGVDTFSARWNGQVQPKYSETYTFYTYSDDGVRLTINGKQLVNNWTEHAPVENSGTITLVAGQKYAITMEYYESGYGAVSQLSWSSASQGKQIVPQSQLFPTTTTTSPTPPNLAGNWNLSFNDDFNTLNTTTWGNRYWWNGDKGQETTFKPENIAVNNGVLTITAKRETATAFDGTVTQYTSGLLTSGGVKDGKAAGFTFKYGYMESRIKFTNGQGLWPSFWAMPASYDDYQGELDTMEIVSARPNIHEMHYHYHGAEAAGSTWNAGIPLGDDYHVYAMDWEPDHISWYVDGVEHFRYTNAPTIVNQPFYFILNYDMGGPWAGSPNSTTPLPAQMNVDYVRLWQK